ncbi:D-inositol-3-phosphate glycosyltransferase [bioreactor metagenome]|uniref:D-inositol-3-phosphate glycosyltransferase n=1 Tax=bioreactor metagenome TaxID=1076179 RepID=A0A645AU51_9ZZZZ
MKVLEINSVCGTGSTGRIACQIADVVVQNGGDARVAYGRSYYEKGCNVPSYRIGSDIDVKIHAGLSRITDRQGFYSKKATKRFVEYVKQYNPDVIHLHNIHGYYLHLPTLFNFLADYDKPVVWTLHDCWAFTGHCSHFDFIGCQKWKTGCHRCPQKNMYPKTLLLDQSKRNWEEKKTLFTSVKNMTIITPSNWLAGLVKVSFLGKFPVHIIHNGIDLEVFKPTLSTWKKEHGINRPIVLACASGWDERKGYSDILKLAGLSTDYQVVIVGVSERQAKSLPRSIIGIQKTESIQDLVKIYSVADVFINTTYEDTFPTVNLEALACGTSVITYDTGGSPECIDESSGIVVEKRNVQELAKKIPVAMRLSGKSCISFSLKFSKILKYSEYYKHFLSLVLEKGGR